VWILLLLLLLHYYLILFIYFINNKEYYNKDLKNLFYIFCSYYGWQNKKINNVYLI